MIIKQYRAKSVKELEDLIKGWKADLLALRFQQAVGKLEKSHKFKELRISVARAMTILAEKKAEEAGLRAAPVEKKPEKKRPAIRLTRTKAVKEGDK